MATPKSIPSTLNATATITQSQHGRYLYIVAMLKAATLDVDGGGAATIGPISLSSPIICKTFTAGAANTVAYYEQ